MSAAELLAGFSRRGIQLRTEGERLIYDAPQGVMKSADLEQLRKHKSELLVYLSREAANTIAEPDGPCPGCGSGQWWQLPGEGWHCRACCLTCRLRPPRWLCHAHKASTKNKHRL